MKFFHVGDLHFGKQLHAASLVDSDQVYWVEQFLKAVDDYAPDGILIAGDVYDKRNQPEEAMKLFDRLLTGLAERDKYVFAVPGNHDSAVRLSHNSSLLQSNRIFIAGELEPELTHITMEKDGERVTVWLMPYVFPRLIADKGITPEGESFTYDSAVRELLKKQPIDTDGCNILVAHQNVLANGVKCDHSESETIIGGLGEIDYTAFDAFDYVALGHIHNAQRVGRETVRYSGCPLYYDFSEINRCKDLTVVTTGPDKSVTVDTVEIPLLHRLLKVEGDLNELLEKGRAESRLSDYYIQCVITDKHVPPQAKEKLRAVYGDNLVDLKRELPDIIETGGGLSVSDYVTKSIEQQFADFYREQQNELMDEVQEELLKLALEQQQRKTGDYCRDVKAVPQTETEELINAILAAVKEDEK